MNRYILISFAVMAAGFYELSGGDDFTPRKPRPAAAVTQQPRPAVQMAKTAIPPQATSRTVARTAAVTSPTQIPAPTSTTPTTAAPAGVATEGSAVALGLALAPALPLDHSAGLAGFAAAAQPDAGLVMPQTLGLAQALASPAPLDGTAAEGPPAPDIRRITGRGVNLRQGPGTIYGLVARLKLGQEVQVLSDQVNGWLRLKVLPDGQVGWISANLLARASR